MDEVDLVLIMSVNPGFGGQSFIALQLKKIEAARKLIDQSGRDIVLQVDGGVTADNTRQCVDAGATALVAGTAAFKGAGLRRQHHRPPRRLTRRPWPRPRPLPPRRPGSLPRRGPRLWAARCCARSRSRLTARRATA